MTPRKTAKRATARRVPGWAVPTEAQEQAVVVTWLRLRNAVFFAPQAEGKRSPKRAGIAKAMGLMAGVPDLILFRGGKVYALELKRLAGGKLSEHQLSWGLALKREGHQWAMCLGANEAIRQLQAWGF